MNSARLKRMRHRRRWLILTAAALAVGVTASSPVVPAVTLCTSSSAVSALASPPSSGRSMILSSASADSGQSTAGGISSHSPTLNAWRDSITSVTSRTEGDVGEIADAVSTVVQNGEYEKPAVLHANREERGKVALTFDDGPHPKLTAPILDLLAKYGIKATFFTIGMNAQMYPDLVERELAEGHEVGNHTQTHPNLSTLSYQEVYDEVLAAEKAVYTENSYKTHLLRPPGGNVGENVMRLAKNLNYDLILWSVDTRDWAHTDTATIVRTVSDNIKNGDVILFHDYVSGESHTLDALTTLIPQLLSRGYEFVTVSELFGLK